MKVVVEELAVPRFSKATGSKVKRGGKFAYLEDFLAAADSEANPAWVEESSKYETAKVVATVAPSQAKNLSSFQSTRKRPSGRLIEPGINLDDPFERGCQRK